MIIRIDAVREQDSTFPGRACDVTPADLGLTIGIVVAAYRMSTGHLHSVIGFGTNLIRHSGGVLESELYG